MSTPPFFPPEGKKVVKRKGSDGNDEWVLRDDDGCWVATAYFQDKHHPEVEFLRSFRTYLLEQPKTRLLITLINKLYFAIGRTKFGFWWSRGASNFQPSLFRRNISSIVLSVTKVIAKKIM